MGDDPCYVSMRAGSKFSGDSFVVAFCNGCRKLFPKEEMFILRMENLPKEGYGFVATDVWYCKDHYETGIQKLREQAEYIWSKWTLQRLGVR